MMNVIKSKRSFLSSCSVCFSTSSIFVHLAVCLAIVISLGLSLAVGQDIPQGITQWSTQVKAGPVMVDMATSNMMLVIRAREKSGAIPFAFDLIDNIGTEGYVDSNNGFIYSLSSVMTGLAKPASTLCGPPGGNKDTAVYDGTFGGFYLRDGTGSKHPFFFEQIRVGPTANCGDIGPVTSVATDGSGYTAVVTGSATGCCFSSVVYSKDGLSVASSSSAVKDTDGNSITEPTTAPLAWTDTLGTTPMNAVIGTGGASSQFFYTDSSGTTDQYYTVAYTAKHVKTIFGCPANPYDVDKPSVFLPTSVTTPTGAKYTIVYETTPNNSPDVTGRLQQVTLPSGGYVKFAYSGAVNGGLNGFECTHQIIPTIQITSNDNNGHTATTTYATTIGPPWQVTETDQLNNVTTHNFAGEFETERTISDVNLGTLSTTITCYNGIFTSCATAGAPSGRIFQKDVYTYPGTTSTSPSLVETKLDQYGDPTEVDRYDFGATVPPSGSPTSKTTYTYDTSTGPCGALSNPYMYDRPCSIVVTGTGGSSTTNYTYNASGHATQTSRLVSGTTFINTTATYNSNGTVATTKDGKQLNTTTYHYDGSCNSLLPTSTTFPTVGSVTLTSSQTWDCNGGVVSTSTDENGKVTTYKYVDPLWRPTQVIYPDTGGTTTTYNTGTTLPWTIATSTDITAALTLDRTTQYDGLNRVTKTQLTSDPDGTDIVDTTYDLLGRKASVSNPHRVGSSPTDGITTYTYDALDRVLTVSEPDGSKVTTSYPTVGSGASTTTCSKVTDEVGNSRQSCMDGLGRLKYVLEDPGTSPHLNYETDYTYDPLNNLLTVTQNGSNSANKRVRTFVYDSMSRLTQVTNPESGTIKYGYDSNSNLTTKTAPSPNQPAGGIKTVITTYTFDALNRLTGKSYADSYTNPPTTAVSYGYDGVAASGCTPPVLTDPLPKTRRTSMCDASGGTSWSHDPLGRVLQESRKINGITKSTVYTFNRDGSVATLNDPSGSTITYTVNGAGRPTAAQDAGNSINYVTSAAYAPFGGITSLLNGGAITTTNIYNDRLQPTLLSAGIIGQNPVFSDCFNFHLKVAVSNPPCSFSASTFGDNGNVYQIVNNRDATGGRTQNFLYDSLNRIQQAYSSGSIWGETIGPVATAPGVAPSTPGIDSWGNLVNRSGVTGKGTFESLSVTVDSNNHITGGYLYDTAGNLTYDTFTHYNYDAENRLTFVNSNTYTYDGDGNRVEKANGATGTLYWRGPGGDPLLETSLTGTNLEEYIFFNGSRVARHDITGSVVHYYFSDHLGTHAVVENASGSACEQDLDYYPYGGEQHDYCATVTQHYRFTGKERDAESGLDNFGARYNASTMGRFMSPDPLGGRLVNPQTLNKYSYTINNPLRYTDPTGLYVCADDPKDGSSYCSSDNDKRFEAARQNDLQSKNADVVNAAKAYGDVNSANGVNVGFADLGKAGEGGITVSHLGADANGNLQAQSDVTINSSARGTALDADVGHEGSHVEDAQTMVQSITFDKLGNYKVGDDISQYRSEQRAYSITDAIYRSANEPFNGCGDAKCVLGAGSSPLGTSERIDQIMLANPKIYHSADGKPLSSTNQGGNVLNITVPH